MFEHTTTRKHDPHVVWNYATDLAINSLIPKEELPEGGLIPGEAFKELTPEEIAQMGQERYGQYMALSNKIAQFPREKSGEWYFAELMADDETREALTNPAQGEGQPGEGEPGEGQPGQGGTPFPGTMDDHGGWDELSDEDRELVKGKVRTVSYTHLTLPTNREV